MPGLFFTRHHGRIFDGLDDATTRGQLENLRRNVLPVESVGKHRRGDYVFITWKDDHPPRHVHVYRDGTLIVKWDLDNQNAMKGAATRHILELIRELEAEGLL